MQRILLSSLVMGGVVAAAIYGTTAFFSDTETSAGNTFTAGSVTLEISEINHVYSGGEEVDQPIFTPNGIAFSLADMKPLDAGVVNYDLTNGANDAHVCAMVTEASNHENGRIDPEIEAGDATSGAGNGELGQFLSLKFGSETGLLTAIDGLWQEVGPVVAEGTTSSAIEYCFGVYDGENCILDETAPYNQAQTDSLNADVQFYAVQTRNNEEFDCSDLNQPIWTNEGTVSGGEANFVQEDGRGTVLQLVTVDDNASRVRWENMSLNLGLSTLTGIDFDTKQVVAPNQPVSNATMRLFIDLDGDTNTPDVQEIVYEPYYNIQAYNPLNDVAMILGNWHTWKTTLADGKFWANGGFLGATPNGGAYATNFTLQQVLTAHPSALIVGINLGMGTWNPGQTILVDNLTINGAPVSLEN
jgi:predicted ribosomally synthesized peptide with SipW-like signal peptide